MKYLVVNNTEDNQTFYMNSNSYIVNPQTTITVFTEHKIDLGDSKLNLVTKEEVLEPEEVLKEPGIEDLSLEDLRAFAEYLGVKSQSTRSSYILDKLLEEYTKEELESIYREFIKE